MITLVITGLLVGLMSSFFGVGGGAIIVPILYFLFPNIPAPTVISSSLGVIFLNGLFNTWNFYRLGKKPSFKIIIPLALAMVVGAQIGGAYAVSLPTLLLKRIFAIVLLLIATKLAFSKVKATNDNAGEINVDNKKVILTILTGLVGGIVAGLTGVGGGVIIVPTLITLYALPFTWLSAYSNPAMAISAISGVIAILMRTPLSPIELPGFLSQFQFGYLNLGLVFILVGTSFISGKFGARLTTKVNQKTAQKAFAVLLYAVSARMLLA